MVQHLISYAVAAIGIAVIVAMVATRRRVHDVTYRRRSDQVIATVLRYAPAGVLIAYLVFSALAALSLVTYLGLLKLVELLN